MVATAAPAPFESLEPRQMLSVTGVVTSAYTTATKLVVVVKYHGDSAIDATTLGNNDLRLTGPNSYNDLGSLVQKVVQPSGDVLGVYNFRSDSASGMWDFRRDNGHYVATLAAGTVSDTAGHTNAEAAIRTFSLWFQTPVMEVVEQSTPHIGTGVATINSFWLSGDGSDDLDSAKFVLRYTSLEPRLFGQAFYGVTLTGPNGFVGTQIPSQRPPQTFVNSTFMTVTTGLHEFSPPGGGWDATDNGVYTLTVTLPAMSGNPANEVVLTRQFTVNITAPRAQMVATARTESTLAVTVRYDAASGIQLSSIGNGDVTLVGRQLASWVIPTMQQFAATLISPAVRAANGSVTAMYRVILPSSTALQGFNYLVWETRGGQVLDNTGHAIGATRLATVNPDEVVLPNVRSATTVSASRSAWDVDVVFNNPGNFIQTSTISATNLTVLSPTAQVTRVSVLSTSVLSDGGIKVRYRIAGAASMTSFNPLASGTYALVLRPNAINQGPLGYMPSVVLGNFTLTL